MKALVISVGTGTMPNRQAAKNIAQAIAYSVKHHNPDKAFFVATRQSCDNTLPLILKNLRLSEQKYGVIEIDDPDNIQTIYEKVNEKLIEIKAQFDNIVVDYTSGTKAMTATLAILATIHEVQELSYITGKRHGGIVQHGTERILAIQPYFATAEHKIKLAAQFFNKSQYSAAISILNQIRKTSKDQTITNRIKPMLQLAKAYAQWDKFQHQNAYKTLLKLKNPQIDQNKRFLGQLINRLKNDNAPETYLIADLINNAERRAQNEQKYDDAVARLYRTIELTAQYLLKRKHQIDPSNAETKNMPKELLEKWNIPPETKTLKLTLERDYQILEAKGEEIGKKYIQDKELKNLLSKRNTSILAHGQQPVNKQTYTQLHKKTIEYTETIIPNLKQLLQDSKFIKWKTT